MAGLTKSDGGDAGQAGAGETGNEPAAAPNTPATPEGEPDDQGAMIVTGPEQGHWRVGIHFGPKPVRVPLAGLSAAKRVAIRHDPRLKIAFEPPATET